MNLHKFKLGDKVVCINNTYEWNFSTYTISSLTPGKLYEVLKVLKVLRVFPSSDVGILSIPKYKLIKIRNDRNCSAFYSSSMFRISYEAMCISIGVR